MKCSIGLGTRGGWFIPPQDRFRSETRHLQ